MMKALLVILVSLVTCKTNAQMNLVPNPSFENYSACVDFPDQVYKATGWYAYRGTPDYFNSCDTVDTLCSVPKNAWGYQTPHFGNAYCGFFSFGIPNATANYREIIGAQLINPLSIGTKYYVSFYINMTYGSYYTTRIATNKIGALFSTIPFNTASNPEPINNFSHVYTDSIVTDTLGWFHVFGSFIADSTYDYIGIGNFFDATHTDTILFENPTLGSYYFVDDVCVSTDSLCLNFNSISETNSIPLINIYPNPSEGRIFIKSTVDDILQADVYDICNRKIKSSKVNNSKSFIDVDENGIYLISVSFKDKIITKIIIISK